MATSTRSSRRPASAKSSRRSESSPPQPDHALAQQRSRNDHECAQFLRIHQKLVGKKTTDEYAHIRFVHRPDESTRKRNLHRNGNMSATNKAGISKRRDSIAAVSSETLHPQEPKGSTRPRTARDAPPQPTSNKPRVRPQSAKPQRTSERDSLVRGQRVSVALLERTNYYNPIPLTTQLNQLLASRSAPRLQAALQYASTSVARHPNDLRTIPCNGETSAGDKASQSRRPLLADTADEISGRCHIVVHMQRLVVLDDSDDDDLHVEDEEEEEEIANSSLVPQAENDKMCHHHTSSPRQHARQDTRNMSCATKAWQE